MATKRVTLTTHWVVTYTEVDWGRGNATYGPTSILGVYPSRGPAERLAAAVGGKVVPVTNPPQIH
jgi:hypothetical protein